MSSYMYGKVPPVSTDCVTKPPKRTWRAAVRELLHLELLELLRRRVGVAVVAGRAARAASIAETTSSAPIHSSSWLIALDATHASCASVVYSKPGSV